MSVEAIKAIQMVYANTTKHDWPDDIWDAICQAIEAAVEEQHKPSQSDIKQEQEPFEGMCINCGSSWSDERLAKEKEKNSDLIACCPERKMVDVYTHPQPKREPLTDEQVDDLHGEANRGFCIEREDYFKAFRDAVLAAHGIK